jgi:hypothetical protein
VNTYEEYAVGLSRLSDYRELPDGQVAYYDDATASWYISSGEEIAELGRHTHPDAYSWWCNSTSHELVIF